MDAELPDFPTVNTQEPVAFFDAAHANDLRNRRFTTGYAFLLCGGAISYSTDAKHSPSQLPAPLKLNSLPLLPPQSMLDTCEPS